MDAVRNIIAVRKVDLGRVEHDVHAAHSEQILAQTVGAKRGIEAIERVDLRYQARCGLVAVGRELKMCMSLGAR